MWILLDKCLSASFRGFRILLGLHPKVQANDIGSVGFLGMVFLSCLIVFFVVAATVGNTTIAIFILPTAAAAYVLGDSVYGTWESVFYRHKVRLEAETKNNGQEKTGIWRYGEYVGAFVATLMLLLPALVAYDVRMPLPFGWGGLEFQTNPEELFVVLDFTVGILAASSIAKLVSIPARPRIAYNSVLLYLCVVCTASIMAILIQDARGFISFPQDLVWSYAVILSGYASHNMMLSILCPKVRQRRPGHLVAFSVYLFLGAILSAVAVGTLVRVPTALFSFFAITLLVMLASGTFRYLLEEPLVKLVLGKNGSRTDPPDSAY